MTSLDKELSDIITRLRAGKDPDTGETHITETEAKTRIEALIASKVREAENIAKLNGRRLEVYQRWEWATREPNRAKVSMHYIGNLYRRFNDLTDQIIELTGNKNYAHYDMDMKTGKILERLDTLQSREQDKVEADIEETKEP